MERVTTADEPVAVAVIGAGSIGVAFAVLFAQAGFDVRVWDPMDGALDRAGDDIRVRLAMLSDEGLLVDDIDSVFGRIQLSDALAVAVDGAALVQECTPEDLNLKRELFAQLGSMTTGAVLASSSSAFVPSQYAADLACADRVVGGHPGNPPYLIPVLELIPSLLTKPAVVDAAEAVYRRADLRTVRVNHEPEGFVFNRLQGAVLREAYCLLRDGVATVEDIDEVVRSGLGRRWCFIGPFETADLNSRGGIAAHAERMGPAYERMGAERGQHDPWTPELVATAEQQRRDVLPLGSWDERVRWRDRQLMRWKSVFDA